MRQGESKGQERRGEEENGEGLSGSHSRMFSNYPLFQRDEKRDPKTLHPLALVLNPYDRL